MISIRFIIGYLECAQLIAQYGPLSVLYTKNEIGFTPSDLAVLSQSDECVSFLKQKIVEAKDKLEKLALERQEQLLQEEKKQQVELQKQKQHWKKKEKRLKKKQRDKERKQKQDNQIEENPYRYVPKDSSGSEEVESCFQTKNEKTGEVQEDFFGMQLNQLEVSIRNETQKNKNNQTNTKQARLKNSNSDDLDTKYSSYETINSKTNPTDSKSSKNVHTEVSNENQIYTLEHKIKEYQKELHNYQTEAGDFQNQIHDLMGNLKNLSNKNMILKLQLDAAQQSIINMEKDLEREKQKNKQMKERVNPKLTLIEENLKLLEKKARQIEKTNNCLACKKAQREMLSLPCLHFLYCAACASNLKVNESQCPFCKLLIHSLLPVKYN